MTTIKLESFPRDLRRVMSVASVAAALPKSEAQGQIWTVAWLHRNVWGAAIMSRRLLLGESFHDVFTQYAGRCSGVKGENRPFYVTKIMPLAVCLTGTYELPHTQNRVDKDRLDTNTPADS